MKLLFCVCCICFLRAVHAQNRVFFKASDVADTSMHRSIKKIKMPWGNPGRFIRVFYEDGSQAYFRKKCIWGFEKADKKILRFKDGNTYQVVDTNMIVIYKTYGPHPVYYFSEYLDSEVKLLDERKILMTLDVDKVVLLYKKSPMIKRLFSY